MTAAVELEDGTRIEFLNVNQETIIVEGDADMLELGMNLLATAVLAYAKQKSEPESDTPQESI